jgi:hypothetical protein
MIVVAASATAVSIPAQRLPPIIDFFGVFIFAPSNQEAAIHLDVSQRSSASIAPTVGRFERQLYHLT